MEISNQNLTESSQDNENDKDNAAEKIQHANDSPSLNSKKKRKKKGQKSAHRKENLITSPENASTSQPDLPQPPVQISVAKEQLNTPEELLAAIPVDVEHGNVSNSEIPLAVKEKKKGRNAKKKVAAEEQSPQVSGKNPVPANNVFPSNKCQKWTSPKPGRINIPAGVYPMNFLRQSPAVNKEPPKQDKFSPYWPSKDVEAGLASGLLINGVIRINPKNYQKSYITSADDEDAKDVLIDGIIDRNRALEGDEVAVKLYDESKWQVEENFDGEQVIQKTGMVVSILVKHHNRRTVGYLKLVNKTTKNTTPKKTGKEAKNATPGKHFSASYGPLSSSPGIQSHPGPSTRISTPVKLEAEKQAQLTTYSETPGKLEHSPKTYEKVEPFRGRPDHINAFTSPPMQMGTYPGVSGNQGQIPPFTGTPGQIPPFTGTPKQIPPFAGTQEKIPPFTGSPSQKILASVPGDGLPETPNSPAKSKVEPFKMPEKVLFSPRDARMPRMWVKTSNLPSGTPVDLNPSNCQNYLFLACIYEWNELPIANGNLLGYIGEADEVDSETTALLLEHDLDVTPYPENLFTLPSLPYKIPQKELDERLDLRHSCIFTIDPVTAKDLDDALSVREIGNGLLEIGVHIADPTFFLEEGSTLDLCVRRRATSIYLVQNVFHMLPKDLCMLCSLLPGEDKLAFSLIMEIDTKSWTVVSHKFSRSIVNSCSQLSYEHAQAFIDEPDREWSNEDFPAVHNGYTIRDLCHAVNLMRPFSATLRERRFAFNSSKIDDDENDIAGGALKINQPKLGFKLDHATCMPQEVFIYENKESHRLIEELMLMANILTAQRLASIFPKYAFLRRHSKPKMKLLNNLTRELSHFGIHLDTSTAGALNASLKQYGPVDPEDQSTSDGANSMVNYCDISDGNTSGNLLNHCVKHVENKMVLSDSKITPNFHKGSNSQRYKHLPKEKKSKEKEMTLSTEQKRETPVGVENLSESMPTVDHLEETLDNLALENDLVESKLKEKNIEPSDEVKVPEEIADSEVHLSCEKNTENVVERVAAVKKVGNTNSPENNRKKIFRNKMPSPPRDSPNDQELARARGLVLNHLCAKPMVRADYYCLGANVETTANKNMQCKIEGDDSRDGGEVKVYTNHYALNIPLYTHFTSPIRRYADIMVHRLLAASLGYAPPPEYDPLDAQKIATNCNKQNAGAKRASEASNELFFRLWVRLQVEQDNTKEKGGTDALLRNHRNQHGIDSEESRSEGGMRETAVVVNAKDYSFDAILLRFGIVVRVYVNKLPATIQSYKKLGTNTISIRWFLPGKNAATRESPRQDITMFNLVDLVVYYSYSARRIRAELLSPLVTMSRST